MLQDLSLDLRLKDKIHFSKETFAGELRIIPFLKTQLGMFDLEERLLEDPQKWIGELHTVMQILDPHYDIRSKMNYESPTGLPGWIQVTPTIGFYEGEYFRGHGVWYLEKDTGLFPDPRADEDGNIWRQVPMSLEASFGWLDDSVDYDLSDFRDARFKSGESLLHHKRDIRSFRTSGTDVIAKETERHMYFFEKGLPSSRLTKLQRYDTSAELPEEVRMGIYLRESGLPVPKTLGLYTETLQEYSFYEKINGESPEQFIRENPLDFVSQDAVILAKLLKCGLGKPGFCDFDDKIFDGEKLWLIDWDECERIASPDEQFVYASNPFDEERLNKYRAVWTDRYEQAVEHTIGEYGKRVKSFSTSLQDLYRQHFWTEINKVH